ncbi:YvrJ family protein [Clostridium cylindrosporum]|uniref:YvrJ protein family n=1 Tax=Clostridium cylindrosporum DSM 605 TaxID=1121307 RepID=A0A0J8DDL0_CLOCY|nr:YvrJ family protein [Clostridium cylindrosporum]KMT22319.1 YvrJ protein family [Clostridium cylindrosporum DSM 605]
MLDENLINTIANIGFPIVVCTYLLTKLDKRLEVLTDTITKLNTIIENKKE